MTPNERRLTLLYNWKCPHKILEEEKQRWASEREKNRKLMKNRGEKYWKNWKSKK